MPDSVLLHLDIQTLFLLLAVLGALVAVVFGGLWVQGVGRPESGPWAAGHGLAGLGYLLSALRGSAPELLGTVLGETLVLAGAVLILKALHQRAGRPFADAWALAGVIAAGLGIAFYTYPLPSPPARIVLYTVAGAGLLGACSAVLLATPVRQRTWTHLLMSGAFLFAAAGLAARAGLALVAPPAGPFGQPLVHGVSKAVLVAAVAGWTLGFLWLITLDLRRTLEREVTSRRRSERLFRSVFEHSANAIALGDEEGRIVLANPAFAELLGRPVAELEGRSFRELTHPDDVAKETQRIREGLAAGFGSVRLEKRFLDHGGRSVWVDLTLSRLRDTVAGDIRYIAVANDIRARKAAEAELEYRATYDALTGAVNRLHFEDLLDRELYRVNRYEAEAALVMFDLDFFKAVNDAHGHATGDAVLREMAARVQGRLRDTDVLARWGGEEFLVLLPETDAAAAVKVGEDLRRLVAGTTFAGGLSLTISVGVAGIHRGDSMKALLKRVDDALYTAKTAGRNRLERAPDHPPAPRGPGGAG
ncbi:GGDEF domain-containing protein [Thiohalorhabdus denitrificans]|uniref:PAS domain S-box-containing protein/diguanylate cyclase (GGDEF) domain-containing protein n=1 Tax=Thiohalorhabdus denitrificans TaxID=381306 RepID=A0A1G5FLY8_9GAMM|nr:diguanylate cyclase [Thiohalorhabdus denitrificans]SCY40213.1 PAS domain S-box-containing protein/diguanylate cyclase (GGDEF) domain-containing protein [Thiohalorhabdus denitrificans]